MIVSIIIFNMFISRSIATSPMEEKCNTSDIVSKTGRDCVGEMAAMNGSDVNESKKCFVVESIVYC